jgi:phosphatidylinositol-bisphosphatase
MTFVNAHLAAFDEQLERRNADFAELSRRLLFDVSVPIPGFKPSSQAIWPPQEPTTTVVTNIYQSDALFWMGDLNYRIDLPDSQVRELLGTAVQNPANKLGEESFELLQKHDQLKKSQRDGKAFVGFNEMRIGYMP